MNDQKECHKHRNDPCACSRKALLCDGFGPPQQAEPVQMHPSQFAELIKGREAMIGVPVYWSEWPTKEKQ